ncbi:DNA polymerase III, tau subunit [Halobacillus karajensis]|uniref:DNA-directed DNA polymerase n=1 Tax=Halobacillus karajensis TaxID=195088 RepID=A0A059NXS6_9BACI|nr:DNA polymerase III subunit gamma/tau [Halobacillus karajensis]CDQ18360.1 DNA polymerase III subunit gamma/tau [Halobacillus karajensis]CDQ23568.1 DNA polymerase III subunit gamma/tau [Halobacillus karajensis]CDQ27050.1 DNA polymerase III subunit gamma/tau [Halobacillus karajensis]SEH52582.1 DNA polymerase III, tau subunit [Halobacillus karajensis]
MSYQALYRVWRPRNFEGVVGQTHITRTLQNAIEQNKFSHAYLFSGPRGTGKTSAAKIFAKAVNCERSPVKEPCNECDACLGIQDGSISDVIEIDAASNNGVEQIREIRDKVKYAPSAVPYKVYIIDEVHMLSMGAFNALLKTLEEPPKHVIFILATTEPHKIPLTIISRCQRFDFKRISQKSMVDRMEKITEVEGIPISKEALEIVALTAEGGMRDALSLLDQAVSYSEDEVTLEDVLAVTGSVSQGKLTAVLQSLYNQDARSALEAVDDLIQQGKDPGRFVFDLIYYLRDLLLFQSAPDLEHNLERAIPDESFKGLSEELSPGWIQQAIRELNRCQQEMKWTTSPKVFIEIAMLNMVEVQAGPVQGKPAESETVDKLTKKMAELEKELTTLKQQGAEGQTQAKSTKKRAPAKSGRKGYNVPYERIRQVLNEASKEDIKNVQGRWADFMEALKRNNAPAHATLLNSKPRAASSKALILAFRYDIHCSLALEHQQTIEPLLIEFIGKPMTIIPIPEPNWQEIREEYVRKQKQSTDGGSVEEGEEGESPQQGGEEEPLVSEARKLVGDDLIEVQD